MRDFNTRIIKRKSPLRRLTWLIALIITSLVAPLSAFAAVISAEDKLKAAFVYKLTRFVTWPPSYSSGSTEHFSFCILGDNIFGDALEPLRSRSLKQLPIEINYYSQSEEVAESCHVVYITASKSAFIDNIIERFKDKPMLTISDIANFSEYGGIIELVRGPDNISFRINLNAARKADLSIAAPLLEISTITSDTKND